VGTLRRGQESASTEPRFDGGRGAAGFRDRRSAPSRRSCSSTPTNLRWQLEPLGKGTRLTPGTTSIAVTSRGAPGWHICFDVLDAHLAGEPIGRMVGMQTMKFDGWQRLQKEYAQHRHFLMEVPLN
jgi:hypothetical protein